MKRIRVEEIDGVLYIDGIDIMKKLSELSKENDRLYLENKKQKEVIDNAIEYVENRIVEDDYMLRTDTDMVQKELLDILKEIEQ